MQLYDSGTGETLNFDSKPGECCFYTWDDSKQTLKKVILKHADYKSGIHMYPITGKITLTKPNDLNAGNVVKKELRKEESIGNVDTCGIGKTEIPDEVEKPNNDDVSDLKETDDVDSSDVEESQLSSDEKETDSVKNVFGALDKEQKKYSTTLMVLAVLSVLFAYSMIVFELVSFQ